MNGLAAFYIWIIGMPIAAGILAKAIPLPPDEKEGDKAFKQIVLGGFIWPVTLLFIFGFWLMGMILADKAK